jgi:hypothetical protein
LPTTVGSSAAHRHFVATFATQPTHHVRKLKWFVWLAKLLKAIFRKPRHLAPKHHFKAARPGDHFLSERPEKCVPMAGGESVTSTSKQLESDPNYLNINDLTSNAQYPCDFGF